MKQRIEAVIEDVIAEPSKVQPIIVQFQNGELKDEEAKKMSCGVFYDKQKDKRLLALSNGQTVYKGYKPESKSELTHTMLVFRNKLTGKVRLVQAERWQVSPILDEPSANDNMDSDSDKLAILNKEFGSKKVKRRTEQYERMKINVDSVKEQLEQTASNITIDRVDLSTQVSQNEYITNTNLPEVNREATKVANVYNVYDIVPESKLQTLFDKAEEALRGEVEGSSKFFTETLKRLQTHSDKVKNAALLIYIEATGAWLNIPIKDAKKKGIDVCPFSTEINSHIINSYSVMSANGRSRSNSMRDKGLIHCMILALIISNFVLDLDLFVTLFTSKISMKKLTELARIILAVPTKDNKKVVTLKLPLPAQVPIIKKGKKK